jgi:hypothetical protein
MKKLFISLFIFSVIVACSSMKLTPADFSWPIEAVLKTDSNGFVQADRYSMKVNVQNLFKEELGLNADYQEKEIRIIRDSIGLYYITSDKFKNVYLFKQNKASLKLYKKILVSETGLENPYFNQRNSSIELVANNIKIYLSNEGIIGGKK